MDENEQSQRLIDTWRARLAPLQEREDGTIYFEQTGPFYVVVTKEGDRMLLWLMDVKQLSSGVIQSELSLSNPLRLVDAYTQATLLTLLWQERPRRVFTTGLGGGCLPMLLHCLLPATEIDCVEIEPLVVEAARDCFGFTPDTTLRVAVNDGRQALARSAARRYDFILIDAFLDAGYTPYSMATRDFAELAHDRLTPNGVLVINLLYMGGFYADRLKSVAAAFPHLYLLRMGADNDLLFAAKRPLPAYANRVGRARALEERFRLHFQLRNRANALAPLDPAQVAGWAHAGILSDHTPPDRYFNWLSSLSDPELALPLDRLCLCGSGLPYGECHGKVG